MKIRNESQIPISALKRWNPDIRAAVGDDGSDNVISILDGIGENIFGEGTTARRISAALRRIGPRQDVVVNINTPGGSFFEGVAIYNLFREHRGSVQMNVLSLAASAGSVITMAGDEIVMNRGAMMMLHNPWGIAVGDHRDFERASADLKKFADRAAEVYQARSGGSSEAIRAMLDEETWLSAAEAYELGFATSIENLPTQNSASERDGNSALKARKTLLSWLQQEGYSRSERRDFMTTLGIVEPGTDDPAEPGTGEDWSQILDMNRYLKGDNRDA